MTRLWMLLVGTVVVLAACGQAAPSPDSQPQADAPAVVATPPPDVPTRSEILQNVARGGPPIPRGTWTLDEVILAAEVIARVSLVGTQGSVVGTPADNPYPYWLTMLEFKFQVHEYLKGSGGNQISGFVYLRFWDEEYAQAASSTIYSFHDRRYDDREAIVFMVNLVEGFLPDLPADKFYFSEGDMFYIDTDTYTVSSEFMKLWLPAAAPSTGARGGESPDKPTTEQRFMLDGPPGGVFSRVGTRGADSAASMPTMSLTDMKARITAVEAEANRGGTEQYRRCVIANKRHSRRLAFDISRFGWPLWQKAISIESGLPAGTVVYDSPAIAKAPNIITGRFWVDGPDKDLAAFGQPTGFGEPYVDPRYVRYIRPIETTRPLPAGSYSFWPNRTDDYDACPRQHLAVNQSVIYLTVTPADPRALHEAFFDPVAIGAAVGADGANGVLSPAAFDLLGTTTTISSLKWEDGAVTMELSPTSTVEYLLDFIDTTGTTTLSLTSDNASTTPLTWTVPVAPWADGDLLMLRLTRSVRPVFSQNSYTFAAAESDAVGDTVGTVTATTVATSSVAYSIASGAADTFEIDQAGAIRLRRVLRYEDIPEHTLTIQSTVDGQAATVDVTIAVENTYLEPAPGPAPFTVTVRGNGFDLSWGAVPHATQYAAQYSIPGIVNGMNDLPYTTATSQRWEPEGGVRCAAEHIFRVFASGDGNSWRAGWGNTSERITLTTAACGQPPVFATSTYSFEVAEDAAVGAAVGTVSASDADAGDTVTYSLADSVPFAIDAAGNITVAGPLDHEASASYSLTIEASDGSPNGQATATATITVMDVQEPPTFATSTYRFVVSEAKPTSTVIGTISASDPDGDAITYTLSRRRFGVDASGNVSLLRPLNYEFRAEYDVVATAASTGGTATATIVVVVEDAAEPPVPSVQGFAATVVDGGIDLSWTAIPGIAGYGVAYWSGSEWTQLGSVSQNSYEYRPDELACGTTYLFTIAGYGNGVAYEVGWGPFARAQATTAACEE